VDQQGRADILARVSSTTRIRKGNRTYAFADLRTGFRVHVDGESLGAVNGLCTVAAVEVKVQ